MAQIYKYQLNEPRQTLLLPGGAKFLHVEWQGADLCVWALITPTAPHTARHIHVFATGEDIPNADKLTYIATAQTVTQHGGYVVHVFEGPAP